jgi:hypothetical protein
MTVFAVLASLVPILWESGIGSDVMKPIAAPIVGGMITSTIHVLILVQVFFVMIKKRELRRGTLRRQSEPDEQSQLTTSASTIVGLNPPSQNVDIALLLRTDIKSLGRGNHDESQSTDYRCNGRYG